MKTLKEIVRQLETEIETYTQNYEDLKNEMVKVRKKDIEYFKEELIKRIKRNESDKKLKTIEKLIATLESNEKFNIENVTKRKDLQRIAMKSINNAFKKIESSIRDQQDRVLYLIDSKKQELKDYLSLMKEYGEDSYYYCGSIFIGDICDKKDDLKRLAILNYDFQRENFAGSIFKSREYKERFDIMLNKLKGIQVDFYRLVLVFEGKDELELIKL